MKYQFFFFLLSVGSSLQASTPSSPTYEAGVVEFNFGSDPNATESARTLSNLQKYLNIMINAPSTLDIIVFPEMTLNGMETAVETKEPNDALAPCENNFYPSGNLIREISCSAKNFKRYVVANIVTKVKCPDEDMINNKDPRDCKKREDGFSYYNTNLVFDRTGRLISRYRKFNLFGEDVDKPHAPAMITFETDFGVRFGHFICFDLMFRKPALELVRKENVTDIVFTTMWFSEMPFLTGVQIQQNWAYSNNVNLLAAGANNPKIGSTGTGIYAAKQGSLISVMNGKNDTQLYTATVPKLGTQSFITQVQVKHDKIEMQPLYLKRDQLDKYQIRFMADTLTADTSTTSKICSDDVCCEFTYSYRKLRSDIPFYRYAMAVYHGNRTFDGYADGGVIACAVIACHSSDMATCGTRNETLEFVHEWYKLEITGTFPYGEQFFYLPTTLDESVMPFRVEEFQYAQRKILDERENVKNYTITMTMIGGMRNFYTFGIYGRDFNLDADVSGSTLNVKTSILMFLILVVLVTIKNLN